MKQKIFIGSSSESAKVATYVKKMMEPDYDCTVWNEGFFEMNESTYHNLVKRSIAYDYAIFIGGADDLIFRKSKKERRYGARDNVYFELGLYAGILSPERSFFLFHEKCKVASDLFGITLMSYSKEKDVEECCEKLKKQIEVEDQLSRITLLPSTSLAYGYYDNFIHGACRAIEEVEQLIVEGKEYQVASMKKSLEIVFPMTTVEDWKDWATLYYKRNRLEKVTLKNFPRDFSVYIDKDGLSNNELRVIDIPQTLRSSFYCVDQMAAKNYTGEKVVSKSAKLREIRNFKKTLKMLILKDSYAKKYIHRFSNRSLKNIVKIV